MAKQMTKTAQKSTKPTTKNVRIRKGPKVEAKAPAKGKGKGSSNPKAKEKAKSPVTRPRDEHGLTRKDRAFRAFVDNSDLRPEEIIALPGCSDLSEGTVKNWLWRWKTEMKLGKPFLKRNGKVQSTIPKSSREYGGKAKRKLRKGAKVSK